MGSRMPRDAQLKRAQLELIIATLRPFALAADRIESVLGKKASDSHPVRRGSLLTLADLRSARAMIAGLKRMEAQGRALEL